MSQLKNHDRTHWSVFLSFLISFAILQILCGVKTIDCFTPQVAFISPRVDSAISINRNNSPFDCSRLWKMKSRLCSSIIKKNKEFETISDKDYSDETTIDSITKTIHSGGGTITPFQILYSSYIKNDEVSINEKENDKMHQDEKIKNSIYDSEGLPLFAAKNMLIEALNKIIKNEALPTTIAKKVQGQHQNITLRIDQQIQHSSRDSISPLLWLRQPSITPKVYLANSQSTIEMAGYGTSSSLVLSGDYVLTESDWDIISSLPPEIKLYGGGRFDPMLPIDQRGDEWQKEGGFRGYFYMVPSVELRKEENGKTYLSVNIHGTDIQTAARNALKMVHLCPTSMTAPVTATIPSPPPILFRDEATPTEEEWERGIEATLNPNNGVLKTVFSRKMELFFSDENEGLEKIAIDIIFRMKLAGHVGHFFYLEPGEKSGAFWGCTPERLFQVSSNGAIQSEALAGTRLRGADINTDTALSSELLFSSPKDMKENDITKNYITGTFQSLSEKGLIKFSDSDCNGTPFVRRLRNLQHICQTIRAELTSTANASEVTRFLLENLHPTPAVCGFPSSMALDLIREHETHDRGYYAGPFGFIGSNSSDICVAIRSSLLTSSSIYPPSTKQSRNSKNKLSVYAGAGIVEGSTSQGEWTEISQKLGVISSLFSSAPITINQSPNANTAFSTLFVEELIRCGITMFYVCPGSRSTPLTAAIAKAVKNTKNVGIIRAVSVFDERGAAYRAIGFARRTGRPAVVVTSSGTAVGNLLPAVMEADEDSVPIVLLTADRPYEARGTGANQAVDQVKVFGTLVRWSRDIPPPSDDAAFSVSPALSDANHAVLMSRTLLGPVHINVQFRENLAPEGGQIRGDNRLDSSSRFNPKRYTDVPGFQKWASTGKPWQKSYNRGTFLSSGAIDPVAVRDIAKLIMNSKRGLIVVGNVRIMESGVDDHSCSADVISHFAKSIGFPILASVMSGALRNSEHTAVVPCAEHLLKNEKVSKNINPDLILQIGAPLVSTEIPNLINSAMKRGDEINVSGGGSTLEHGHDNMDEYYNTEFNQQNERPLQQSAAHVLVHLHAPYERADPDCTVTHVISSSAAEFFKAVLSELDQLMDGNISELGSDLAPLVLAGRALREALPDIIHNASSTVIAETRGSDNDIENQSLTEPEVILAISEVLQEESTHQSSLFLSNSMPIRDAEFFLYPFQNKNDFGQGPFAVGVNRGASGIDGIISAATGFSDGSVMNDYHPMTSSENKTTKGTTLLIGDLASLHDINALHGLSRSEYPSDSSSANSCCPLTTVIVNNNGGGIFSFLPIARHASEVGFEEFFGTPTDSFSFEQGAKAFGLPYTFASSFQEFKEAYRTNIKIGVANLVEANVVERSTNVLVHAELTRRAIEFIDDLLTEEEQEPISSHLPYDVYVGSDLVLQNMFSSGSPRSFDDTNETKTVLLLHGWMGDKTDWKETATLMTEGLPRNWRILALDLPGHGDSKLTHSSKSQVLRRALNLDGDENSILQRKAGEKKLPNDGVDSDANFAIDNAALLVLQFLNDMNITHVDAICGYSLGGRVALAMNRICSTSDDGKHCSISEETSMILLSANPGQLSDHILQSDSKSRIDKDDFNAQSMIKLSYRSYLQCPTSSKSILTWSKFLSSWYGSSLWGRLQSNNTQSYKKMLLRRVDQLSRRACDLASSLSSNSPPRNSLSDWKFVQPTRTLYVSGNLDEKYKKLGKQWSDTTFGLTHKQLPNAGHALLVEDPVNVARLATTFILGCSFKRAEWASTTLTFPKIVNTQSKQIISRAPVIEESIAQDWTETANGDKKNNSYTINGQKKESSLKTFVELGTLDFEVFAIDMMTDNGEKKGVAGIGSARSFSTSNVLNQRTGYIIQILSSDGSMIGIGEISPLPGLHNETFQDAGEQLKILKKTLAVSNELISKFEAYSILALDGSLSKCIDLIAAECGFQKNSENIMFPSVRSGLEMSILALASQAVQKSLPFALISKIAPQLSDEEITSSMTLALNGLITRGASVSPFQARLPKAQPGPSMSVLYPSLKVKVGHQSVSKDVQAILNATAAVNILGLDEENCGMVRADANRGWNLSVALEFASALQMSGIDKEKNIEFIEEPLEAVNVIDTFRIVDQLEKLEHWHKKTKILYALDESLADLALLCEYDFDSISHLLREAFKQITPIGCAAFVLKPALLGLELSMRIARYAKQDLGVNAVFSSSFDSGVGLAYAAFMAANANAIASISKVKRKYSHGLGTFEMLAGDTLIPSFGSYVNNKGQLNVSSLARALYGLGLDEMRGTLPIDAVEDPQEQDAINLHPQQLVEYQSRLSTSSSGREINIQVSLPLPFSDNIASSTFTDLPQQSRWSPWLSSVEYMPDEGETEWKLNVRGFQFKWRATSSILDNPKGITWESVSGVKNRGIVNFIPTSEDSCVIKVNMKIVTPRILAIFFYRRTSLFLEDFLQDKLFKWSLEMFRDLVKADLAVAKGDMELGDALFNAVEGRASAIEATLSSEGSNANTKKKD